MVVHNFAESLARSHAAEDLPCWAEAYKQAFPTMVAMVNHRLDGDHQRAGIDRSITLENAKQILIDEKVRFRNKKTGMVYEDVALEFWSDAGRRVPGWVCKPLLCDYIAYAIAPLGKCYMLPVLPLQEAWRRREAEWAREYPRVLKSPNEYNGRRWETHSRGIPVPVLFKAIGSCLRVTFTPFEEETLKATSK